MLKRIFILGRIEYRILFVWWKLNESNIEYYSLIKKIFEYYSNTWKYSNIRIYSNKFAKNVKVSESKIFTYPKNTFQSERIFHILTLINKNYRSSPCSQNIVQISSLFLKNLILLGIFTYNWSKIFVNIRTKIFEYSNIIRTLEIVTNRIRISIFGRKYSNIFEYSNIRFNTVNDAILSMML